MGTRFTPVLSFWFYNENLFSSYLTVDLGEKLNATSEAQAGFKVKLNFTSWRAIGISLNNDQNHEMTLNATNTSSDGTQDSIGRSLGANVDSIRFKALLISVRVKSISTVLCFLLMTPVINGLIIK